MTLVAGSSTVARTLSGFWDEARLRADEAKSTSVRPAPGVVPWRAALEDILNVGYGVQTQCRFVAGGWEQVRWRTTPSAGAIYPFDVVAGVVGDGTYLWDARAGRLLTSGLPTIMPDDLPEADLVTPDGHQLQVLLVVLARPWLSMKKYRLRGYPYCHLDVGHVTTNLAIYATALGYGPTLHLRFSRQWFADRLRLAGLCREPMAVLSFARADPIRLPQHDAGLVADAGAPIAELELPGTSEIENWESLRGVLSFDGPIEPPTAPATAPLIEEPVSARRDRMIRLPDGIAPPSTASECRSTILARRSAKGFRDRSLSVTQLGALLRAFQAEGLTADCTLDDTSRLGVRVVAKNVDGLAGVFAYAPRHHALCAVDAEAGDFTLACMKQGIAGDAAALLLVHAPADRLLDGHSPFAELHFHAAQLGQRLHLMAAGLGIGMTCIGGFDGVQCAVLARLDPAREAIYVILLGISDESAIKRDRLRIAYSHGYTTEEG